MTDSSRHQPSSAEPHDAVGGGGPRIAAPDPVAKAVAMLELLSAEAREAVLAKMDPAMAERIRMRLESMPDERPHADFSRDLAERRRAMRELIEGVHERRTAAADRAAADLDPGHAGAMPGALLAGAGSAAPRPATPEQALALLRTLHPAAVARALQGERAEAWSVVLDHLDENARSALQLYLDTAARTAIQDARTRQAELRAQSPALVSTIEAAIARTVVPRAMREHHLLLSTTPTTWQPAPGA